MHRSLYLRSTRQRVHLSSERTSTNDLFCRPASLPSSQRCLFVMREDVRVLSTCQGVYKLNYCPISFARVFSARLIGDPEGLPPSPSAAALLVWGWRAGSEADFQSCRIQFSRGFSQTFLVNCFRFHVPLTAEGGTVGGSRHRGRPCTIITINANWPSAHLQLASVCIEVRMNAPERTIVSVRVCV